MAGFVSRNELLDRLLDSRSEAGMTVESDTPNQTMTSTYCVNPMEGHNVGHQTLDKLYIGCIVSANNHIHIWASGFLDPLCSVLSQNQSLGCSRERDARWW